MMKNSLYMALLLLVASLSVVCHAESLKRRFVVEFQRGDAGSPIQNFSIKIDSNTLLFNQSDIADKNSCAGSASLPDDSPRGIGGCELKTTLIESLSWLWVYATSALVADEFLITNTAPRFRANLWLGVGAFIAVGWIIKSYWNPDSPLFKPMGQLKASQDNPFANTIMMLSGNGQQQGQQQSEQSESSSPQASANTFQIQGSVTGSLSSDSGGGNEDPEQHQQHTLGLNCFVASCNGACIFRPSPESRESAELPLNVGESSTGQTGTTPEQSSYPCPEIPNNVQPKNNFHEPMNQQEPIPVKPTVSPTNAGAANTAAGRRYECEVIVVGQDGDQRPCGMIFWSAKRLACHKIRFHSRLSTGTACKTRLKEFVCDAIVILENGRQLPCGSSLRNKKKLSIHKKKYHVEPAFCDLIVCGEDANLRVCGTVFINSLQQQSHSQLYHEGEWDIRWSHPGRSDHITGSHFCDLALLVDDGVGGMLRRLCGVIFNSTEELLLHRRTFHQNRYPSE
ncbi:hypothetical protein [Endozoicomonas sp. 8E]|uniref:hypothetical protein n=1 Tax=Endozoicomonas sp. 8E TaxID=3035692 RepID=UPI0029391CB4|nr:hypothetical protein [Endozoicomonas sp. 8E]WOG28492.1 hypothetical protein P6910_02215 [Endozoicomonas sp. 8E]